MLEDIKALLGITSDDLDDKLSVILSLVQRRLCSLLGTEEVPEEMSYIATEVAVARFNRIGSEGMASHSVEGESVSYQVDDFSAFADDIQNWRDAQEDQVLGRIRFL